MNIFQWLWWKLCRDCWQVKPDVVERGYADYPQCDDCALREDWEAGEPAKPRKKPTKINGLTFDQFKKIRTGANK